MTAPVEQSACILLIGMRGSGKSTIGRCLATLLDRAFIELDDLAARAALSRPDATSADIPEVFRTLGEGAFRAAEVAVLRDVLTNPDSPSSVVALGGGAPTAPGAEELIAEARSEGGAHVVYLRVDAVTLRERLLSDPGSHRPSLTGRPVHEELADLLSTRGPVYERLADVSIEQRAGETAEACADRVRSALARIE